MPRILNPVVLVLDELPKLCRDAKVRGGARGDGGPRLRTGRTGGCGLLPRGAPVVVALALQTALPCRRRRRRRQVADYVEAAFGGVEACRKAILLDFFRHAFDGSGAGARQRAQRPRCC